jgi:Recombinase
MDFNTLVRNIGAKVRSEYIKKKTATKLDRYQHSSRLRLSRLYGYRVKDDEKAERVPEEAAVVRKVFDLFAQGKSVESIKKTLDAADMRTRFHNLWTIAQLMSLVKPIYCGLVAKKMGGFVKSDVYPAIIPFETYERARKQVKKQVEEAEIDPVTAVMGGRD